MADILGGLVSARDCGLDNVKSAVLMCLECTFVAPVVLLVCRDDQSDFHIV